jgi:hypothetical protein
VDEPKSQIDLKRVYLADSPTRKMPRIVGADVLSLAIPMVVYIVTWVTVSLLSHWFGESFPNPGLASPSRDECAVAAAILSFHRANAQDRAYLRSLNRAGSRIKFATKARNSVDARLQAADWRWCPGLSPLVRRNGWASLGTTSDDPRLELDRPTFSADAVQAKVEEAFIPSVDDQIQGPSAGPNSWVFLTTRLRRDQKNGEWRVTAMANEY